MIDSKFLQTVAASAKTHITEVEDHTKNLVAGAALDAEHVKNHLTEAARTIATGLLHIATKGVDQVKDKVVEPVKAEVKQVEDKVEHVVQPIVAAAKFPWKYVAAGVVVVALICAAGAHRYGLI